MMEFRLEERGISVESVEWPQQPSRRAVPLEGSRWTRNSADEFTAGFCGCLWGETNGSCV
jgi:hypothetical protein